MIKATKRTVIIWPNHLHLITVEEELKSHLRKHEHSGRPLTKELLGKGFLNRGEAKRSGGKIS